MSKKTDLINQSFTAIVSVNFTIVNFDPVSIVSLKCYIGIKVQTSYLGHRIWLMGNPLSLAWKKSTRMSSALYNLS